MQICYPIQRTFPEPLTGSEIYLHDLARWFATTDDVTIVTTDRSNRSAKTAEIQPPGLRVERFPLRDGGDLRLAARYLMQRDPTQLLSRLIAAPANGALHAGSYGFRSPALLDWLVQHPYEVVHAAAVPVGTAWAAWRGSAASRSGFVLSPFLHLADPEVRRPYIARMLQSADQLLAATETERRYLLTCGVSGDVVSVIPPWVDLERFEPGDRRRFRSAWRIPPTEFVVLIPRKLEDKGAFHTLGALELLARRGIRPTCVLLGTTRQHLQARIDEHARRLQGLGVRTVDLGYLPKAQLSDALAGCDVVVEPSRVDSFGMIYQDAWLHDHPVIAARSGAVPDVVQDDRNGLLVEFGSVEGIARAIASLVEDPALVSRLGGRGGRDVRERYAATRLAPLVRAVYESAASRKGSFAGAFPRGPERSGVAS